MNSHPISSSHIAEAQLCSVCRRFGESETMWNMNRIEHYLLAQHIWFEVMWHRHPWISYQQYEIYITEQSD